MAGEHYLTRSHEVIRRWADARGARPSTVTDTQTRDDPGVIRLDFPDRDDIDPLEPIGWDEWFAKFDAAELVLMFGETTPEGAPSTFNRLLESDAAADSDSGAEWIDEVSPLSP